MRMIDWIKAQQRRNQSDICFSECFSAQIGMLLEVLIDDVKVVKQLVNGLIIGALLFGKACGIDPIIDVWVDEFIPFINFLLMSFGVVVIMIFCDVIECLIEYSYDL